MHDVISKTLPADPVQIELERMEAKWGRDVFSTAGKAVSGQDDLPWWTRPLIAKADAHLQTLAATKQDSAMLDRDEPKAAPELAVEDPLVAAVSDAIQYLRDSMFECALSEVQNSGRIDPDYARADDAEADLLKAIDALIAGRTAPAKPSVCDSVQVADNGLLTSHNPDRRLL